MRLRIISASNVAGQGTALLQGGFEPRQPVKKHRSENFIYNAVPNREGILVGPKAAVGCWYIFTGYSPLEV